MKLKQLVAGAAIGCTLGAAGIGVGSGIANAAPPCNPGPGAQCGPGVVRADLRRSVGPAAHHLRTSAARRSRRPPPATSAAPAVPAAHPATSTGRADPVVHRQETSGAPAITTGDHRGIRRTTTGADGSTAPHGVTDCRRGAGAHHRRRSGMGRCHPRGGRRHRPSTTSVSTSNRSGTPATTNGVSTSSGFGFRSRSDTATRRSHQFT